MSWQQYDLSCLMVGRALSCSVKLAFSVARASALASASATRLAASLRMIIAPILSTQPSQVTCERHGRAAHAVGCCTWRPLPRQPARLQSRGARQPPRGPAAPSAQGRCLTSLPGPRPPAAGPAAAHRLCRASPGTVNIVMDAVKAGDVGLWRAWRAS